jgi:DNA repair exonuclease SbcCD ATPase subunit
MKSHLLSIIAASIIVLGGSFIVVNTILAKDEASELDKKAEESQLEFEKQSQEVEKKTNEAQKKVLEQQREQAKKLSEKAREAEKQALEKQDKKEDGIKEDRTKSDDQGQDDSVDALSEQITIGSVREKKIKDKCQEISNKISEHQNELKAKAEKRLGKYNKIIARLEAVSIKLADLGVDVTMYNGYVVEVKSRVADLNTLTQTYIASLSTDVVQLCNKDQAAAELNTRKAELKAIVAQDKSIRSYIKETIIPYLRSIKPQQPASTEQENTTAPAVNSTPIQ